MNAPALTEFLEQSALEFARKNAVAHIGDIVMSDFGSKGILRKTKIVSVSVMLTAHFKGVFNMETHVFYDNPWELEFIMNYAGKRIRKDGTFMGTSSVARCLTSFVKPDGTVWATQRNENKRTCFNHCGLNWSFEQSYNSEAQAYVC